MGRRYTDDSVLMALGERVVAWFEESVDHWQAPSVQS
jgi:predicted DNA-binding transcriptional regulator AlpA